MYIYIKEIRKIIFDLQLELKFLVTITIQLQILKKNKINI